MKELTSEECDLLTTYPHIGFPVAIELQSLLSTWIKKQPSAVIPRIRAFRDRMRKASWKYIPKDHGFAFIPETPSHLKGNAYAFVRAHPHFDRDLGYDNLYMLAAAACGSLASHPKTVTAPSVVPNTTKSCAGKFKTSMRRIAWNADTFTYAHAKLFLGPHIDDLNEVPPDVADQMTQALRDAYTEEFGDTEPTCEQFLTFWNTEVM